MKIGFLGPEGTFCEEASKIYARRVHGRKELVPYATIHDLLFDADRGKVAEAIVPIENSIEGTVGVVTDMLVKDVRLVIRQEIVLDVYHYLVAQRGIKLAEVTDVISHPQAIEQCKEFLLKKLPRARLHLAHSTGNAVKQVGTSLGEKIIAHGKVKGSVFAAIGTEAAAKMYGLKVLASRINAKDNQTRFVVLAGKDHPRTGRDKTSLVFSIKKDRPGGLHDLLQIFADRNINLTKIESRPSKKALGDYYFFADLYGHRTDPAVARALAEIKHQAGLLKLLGSYPRVAR